VVIVAAPTASGLAGNPLRRWCWLAAFYVATRLSTLQIPARVAAPRGRSCTRNRQSLNRPCSAFRGLRSAEKVPPTRSAPRPGRGRDHRARSAPSRGRFKSASSSSTRRAAPTPRSWIPRAPPRSPTRWSRRAFEEALAVLRDLGTRRAQPPAAAPALAGRAGHAPRDGCWRRWPREAGRHHAGRVNSAAHGARQPESQGADAAALAAYWKQPPRTPRCALTPGAGGTDAAQDISERALEHSGARASVALYGEASRHAAADRAREVAAHARARPALLLALGKRCMRRALWGKRRATSC
jgi:hypothetical protein